MTSIAIHGCKQAPGATTLALALVAILDADGGAVLVESDPQGGDIAAMTGRAPTPGLLSLAAAGRHGAAVDLSDHLQPLPAGGGALLAPSEPAQVAAGLAAVGPRLEALAADVACHVVVDRGRGEPNGSDHLVLLVCHPTVAGVEQARVRSEAIARAGSDVVVAVTDAGPYRADEVAAALSIPVVGTIPRDPRAVAALTRGGGAGAARRSPLLRAAATIAAAVEQHVGSREPAW